MKSMKSASVVLVLGVFGLLLVGGTGATLLGQGALADFAGTWSGTWSSGFGSGGIGMDVQIMGNDVTAVVTLTGVIFANPGPHAPFTMTGTFDPGSGIVMTDPDNPIYGPLTITIGLNGSGTASAPMVPGGLVTSATGSGMLDLNAMTGSGSGFPSPNFGGSANSTFTIALGSTPGPEPPGMSEIFFPQIGDGLAGTIGFVTTFVVENTSTMSAEVDVSFFQSDGSPMNLNLLGMGSMTSYVATLEAGQTVFLQTAGIDPLQVGYARVMAPEGVSGTGIFTRMDGVTGPAQAVSPASEVAQTGGTVTTKAAVPASTLVSDFSVPVDTRGSNNIGLALVNPPGSGGSADITLRLYGTGFNLLGTKEISLGPGEHLPRFVTDGDFFEGVAGVNEMSGSLTVASSLPIAATVLLQDDDLAVDFPTDVPILTAFPAIPGRADGPAPVQIQTFYFPQIGEGVAGAITFSTLMILENTSPTAAANLTVDFFQSSGAAMAVEVIGMGKLPRITPVLQPGETVFLETPGTTDPLQVGYARVTAPSGVSGTGIFTRQDSGTVTTKAAVPASRGITDFSVPVDTRGNNDIGLALVNAGNSNATVTLRLYDTDFNLLGTKMLNLGPGAHLPRFVTDADFFADVPGVTEMTGSMTVSSTQALAATVLLQADNVAVDFPTEVPILTAFPAIEGRADSGQ